MKDVPGGMASLPRPVANALQLGSVFAGRYRVVEPLSETTLGFLFAAERLTGGTPCTIAIVRPEIASDALRTLRVLDRLFQAGRSAHPNIVQVFGRDIDAEAGLGYAELEALRGPPLDTLVEREGPLGTAYVPLIRGLANALAATHQAGAAHGVLTPRALLYANKWEMLKVLDLGIGPEVATSLRDPKWSAPAHQEQPLTPTADVWTMGLLAFYAITGFPFWLAARRDAADSAPALLSEIAQASYPPASQRAAELGYRGELPSGFDAWFARCVALDAKASFANAQMAASSLLGPTHRPVTTERPVTSPPAPYAPQAPAAAPSPAPMPASAFEAEDPTGAPAFAPAAAGDTPPFLDEDVQFTVYKPKVVGGDHWYPLLAFAHLSERRANAPDDPDPLEELERQARRMLGDDRADFRVVGEESSLAVPQEGQITFIPTIEEVDVNPPQRSFLWTNESVHREEFRLRAHRTAEGRTLRGHLTVLLGHIILAEINLSLRVDSASARPSSPAEVGQGARPYRKIFASYSHKDLAIVEDLERYAAALGDRYLRDGIDLRSGEVWSEGLEKLIREADLFQLFWSHNSMRSPFVRREWEYALALARHDNFIRPTYWEDPRPSAEGLPPAELDRLHFQRIGVLTRSIAAESAEPRVPDAKVTFPASDASASPLSSRPVDSRRTPKRKSPIVVGVAAGIGALAGIFALRFGPMTAPPSVPGPTPAAVSPKPASGPGGGGGAAKHGIEPPPIPSAAVLPHAAVHPLDAGAPTTALSARRMAPLKAPANANNDCDCNGDLMCLMKCSTAH